MGATRRRFYHSLTFWSMAGLAAGLGLGIYGFETGSEAVRATAAAFQPAGILWLNALQMAVIPLVVAQMLSALVGGEGGSVGSAGGRAIGVFLTLLIAGSVLSLLVSSPLVKLYTVSPETLQAIRDAVIIPASAAEAATRAPASFGEWIVALVPTNVFQAVARGDILPILLATVIFGLAVNQLPEEQRAPLGQIFTSLATATLVLVRWILIGTPVGVFALTMGISLGTGAELAGILAFYVLARYAIYALCIGGAYPVAVVFGRTSLRDFARGAAPGQLVGLSTRSSLASLPAQIEGGTEHLRFSHTTNGFTVPLSVSAFKIGTAVNNGLRVLFLAHIFGISLGAVELTTFMVTVILISFSTLGVPRGGGSFRSLPAYVAIGIPIEGLVILEPTKDIVDYGTTVQNVTGQFLAATLLSRPDRKGAAAVKGGRVGAGRVQESTI